jgi:hypothetical protein
VERYPSAFGYALGAFDFYLAKPKEVVIISGGDADGAARLGREVWGRFMPNKVVALATGEDDGAAAELVPLLRERTALGGRATAYVCESYTCLQPAGTPEELGAQLEQAGQNGPR